MKRKIVLRPHLVRGVEVKSDQDARKREAINKQKLSYLHSLVYAAVFGGEASPIYKNRIERVANGLKRNFKPDVFYDKGDGAIYTEVKSTSNGQRRPGFTEDQIENYIAKHLDNLFWRKPSPEFRAAVFVYGSSDRANLSLLNNADLVRKVAGETRNLIVIPSNLLFYLFMDSAFSGKETLNQESSDSSRNQAVSFKILGRTTTGLSQPDFILRVRDRASRKYTGSESVQRGLLCLDELAVEQSYSPRINFHYFSEIPLVSFPVTRWFNRDESRWQEVFGKNHELIIKDLGIKDLFSMDEKDLGKRLNPETLDDLNGEDKYADEEVPF